MQNCTKLNLSKKTRVCLVSDFVTTAYVGLRVWMDILKEHSIAVVPSVVVTGPFSSLDTKVIEIEDLILPQADLFVMGYVPQPSLWKQAVLQKAAIIWDPIFMDQGRRYPKLNPDYPDCVKTFGSSITLALPNVDEAKHIDFVQDQIVTGCSGLVHYGQMTFPYPRLEGSFPGAGDHFTAHFISALLKEATLEQAIQIAIENTYQDLAC